MEAKSIAEQVHDEFPSENSRDMTDIRDHLAFLMRLVDGGFKDNEIKRYNDVLKLEIFLVSYKLGVLDRKLNG